MTEEEIKQRQDTSAWCALSSDPAHLPCSPLAIAPPCSPNSQCMLMQLHTRPLSLSLLPTANRAVGEDFSRSWFKPPEETVFPFHDPFTKKPVSYYYRTHTCPPSQLSQPVSSTACAFRPSTLPCQPYASHPNHPSQRTHTCILTPLAARYKNPASYYQSPMIHTVTLSGLEPGARYMYRVDGGDETFDFVMVPSASRVICHHFRHPRLTRHPFSPHTSLDSLSLPSVPCGWV